MIVAEPDEELPCELGHGLGHGRQAAPQYPVQVLIGVILCVQERVCRAILPGQGGKGGAGARARRCGQAQGLPLWDRAWKSHLHEGELNGRNPRKSREGIGAAVHGQRPDPGEGQEGAQCGFRVAHVFPLPPAVLCARCHLHLGFPAVVGDHHLLVEGLPTAVGRVHLGAGLKGHWSGSSSQQLPFIPCSWPGSCLLQNVLNEADEKGAGLGVKLVIPCREGGMPALRLGTQGQGAPNGGQVVALPPTHPALRCPGSHRPQP